MTPARLIGLAVALGFGAGIAWLSALEVNNGDGGALLRLSWRTQPIRVEQCRTLSDDELAALPAHMRRAEECTGGFVDYELTVAVDGALVLADTVAPSGVRRDRPIYVLRDHRLTPGPADVAVSFRALVPDGYEDPERPILREWSGSLELVPGQIALLTLDRAGAFARR